ncbi:S26 family signal peptidase [Gluconacetobacter aggeris]|uniref:S26 family signal peptidase n=1 Tax=Gluconacetobacter aggeris TaxID=1286186 RepID=A0A7W4IV78_9PROT|nr:S26 family signal peptidase [Gluconacetobacter aggeris]MBB2169666.1 S26 family signal peptidase [Gluconacetobacter aggeris]
MTRRGWFFTTYFAVLSVGVSLAFHPAPRVIWNATASVPVGLYRLRPDPAPQVGDVVALRLSDVPANLMARRGYLPFGVPLLKPVAAITGQIVCRFGPHVIIDGTPAGDAKPVDHRGRPLPVWQGCRRLDSGQVFVMNPAEPRSLDGRYFGPLPVSAVIGRATPLWLPPGPEDAATPAFTPSSKGR